MSWWAWVAVAETSASLILSCLAIRWVVRSNRTNRANRQALARMNPRKHMIWYGVKSDAIAPPRLSWRRLAGLGDRGHGR